MAPPILVAEDDEADAVRSARLGGDLRVSTHKQASTSEARRRIARMGARMGAGMGARMGPSRRVDARLAVVKAQARKRATYGINGRRLALRRGRIVRAAWRDPEVGGGQARAARVELAVAKGAAAVCAAILGHRLLGGQVATTRRKGNVRTARGLDCNAAGENREVGKGQLLGALAVQLFQQCARLVEAPIFRVVGLRAQPDRAAVGATCLRGLVECAAPAARQASGSVGNSMRWIKTS